jgi:hypothetical protein
VSLGGQQYAGHGRKQRMGRRHRVCSNVCRTAAEAAREEGHSRGARGVREAQPQHALVGEAERKHDDIARQRQTRSHLPRKKKKKKKTI